ncbi:hypothetical protein MMYC01_207304 [Madurella mycetomatis]|uniref:Uncharacterized protein n=1 Tax=Madurella mycetomatis TaxID=100816 RepID=A0A175W035_9PEZI|nr:hypothetical protein MMYC01_207304 [Madurella mycetomatis]
MASASGVNFVRYFFYAGNTITKQRKQALVALAYATARDLQLAPKAILIRADIHDTTTFNGKYGKDPNGWHGTFAFKDNDQIRKEVTLHLTDTQTGKRISFSERRCIPRKRWTLLEDEEAGLYGQMRVNWRNM